MHAQVSALNCKDAAVFQGEGHQHSHQLQLRDTRTEASTHTRAIHVTLPGSDKRSSETLTLPLAAIKGTTGPIVPPRHPELCVAVFVCIL